MKTDGNSIVKLAKEDGNRLAIAKGEYRILVNGKQTNGNYAVIEMKVPSGAGPMPHSHGNIQETFFVAEGEIEFRSEQGTVLARKGDTIVIPFDGPIHAFKNVSSTDVLLICTVAPAGMDEMFEEVAGKSPEEAKAIGEKYGNSFYPGYFD